MWRKNKGRKNGDENKIGKRRRHKSWKVWTKRWDGREVRQEEGNYIKRGEDNTSNKLELLTTTC